MNAKDEFPAIEVALELTAEGEFFERDVKDGKLIGWRDPIGDLQVEVRINANGYLGSLWLVNWDLEAICIATWASFDKRAKMLYGRFISAAKKLAKGD